MSAAQWSRLCSKTFTELQDSLEITNGRDYKDDLLDLLASIPDEYIPEYWEVISPHFMLENLNVPDHYLLRRFVKHFHSYGTIKQFLAFLFQKPESFQAVCLEENRWLAFFQRARELMPESGDLEELLQTVFYQLPLDTSINFIFYELQKRVEAGKILGLNFTRDFLDKVNVLRN